jgi:TRAP-type C4-dicarboxylate transport system permease small subunit
MSDAGVPARPADDTRPPLIERLSGTIAMLGGLLSLCTAMLVVVSVIGRRFFDAPINGDFELVQMATAISIFSFLPYCEARRGNILVDTFTTWLPPRANARIDAFWDLVYAIMMGVITVCLTTGVIEHFRSRQTTMLLQLVVWPALAICAALALLLTFVALASAARLVRGSQ